MNKLTFKKINIVTENYSGDKNIDLVDIYNKWTRQYDLNTLTTRLYAYPETCLNPKSQLKEFQKIYDEYKNYDMIFILTYSELGFLRLGNLIKRGIIYKEDVNIIYIDHINNKNIPLQLRYDNEGRFKDNWPNGCFDEVYDELFGDF